MIEVIVPRDNVNDDSVKVIKINCLSGADVAKGEVIVAIETSKTVLEIESPTSGVVTHNLTEGLVVPINSTLFAISNEASESPISLGSQGGDEVKGELLERKIFAPKFSEAAKKIAHELMIDTTVFNSGWITSQHIMDLARPKKSSTTLSATHHRSTNQLIILGGGGHAKMCIDILRSRAEYQIIGIIDSKIKPGSSVLGIEVLGDDSFLPKLRRKGVSNAINGLGSISDPIARKKTFDSLKAHNFYVPNLIHQSAIVEPSVTMGEGNQIMMGACIGSDAKILDNCIVNSGAIVSHDSILYSHCHIAPGAILAGMVSVGELSVIGMGATVYLGVSIGQNTVINNGVNLTRDTLPGEVVKSY